MIVADNKQLVPVAPELRKRFGRIHKATAAKFVSRGVCVDGRLVKLPAKKINHRWWSSPRAIEQFLEELTGGGPAEVITTS